MKKEFSLARLLPVMFGFFIMGFVDIIGVGTSNVKADFSSLSDTQANLLSLSCFFWFLVLSVPTGMLMNRIGRKNTVLLSFLLHVIAMVVPLVVYDFASVMVAFGLLGMANTLLQVSLNPLVTDVVGSGKVTGTLTLGQFVKAISSFVGPFIVAWASGTVFGWKLVFPIYAGMSLLALVWLWFTKVDEVRQERAEISFRATFELFRDRRITLYFIGILVLVGADVGVNVTFPEFLMERCGLVRADAGLGNSVYFFARMLGAFCGGILLMKYPERKFFAYSVYIALAGLIMVLLTGNLWFILFSVVVFGIGYANLFSIIFSLSLQRRPDRANEVSALLIAGIAGGAVLPPILGAVSGWFGTQSAAMAVLIVVWLYMVWLIREVKKPVL